MNDADKQDLDEQIEHHKEMLRILRRRLRVQERKEAEFGISVPAEVATEIMTLSERIAKHEAELGRLRSIAAEGDIPLAEVEYRAALATAWEPGKPTVAGAANLEWVRLRTGIKTNRAEVLEKEVRAALAEEAVDKVPSYEFTGRRNLCVIVVDDSQNGRNFYYEVPPLFLALDKYDNRVNLLVAIYLDVAKTIYLISKKLYEGNFRVTNLRLDSREPEILELKQIEPNITATYVFAGWLYSKLALYADISGRHPQNILFKQFADNIASHLKLRK